MAALTQLRPMLAVTDMRATIEFWTEKLGFTVGASMATQEDAPPFWCNLQRDAVAVMFTWEPEHTHDDGEIHRSEALLGGSLYFNVDDVDALADELAQRGAIAADERPQTQPHGMREVAVEDPNGFHVLFGQPA